MPKRCRACQGEYSPTTPDGLRYFHACPPVKAIRVSRAGNLSIIPVSQLQPTDLIRVTRAGATVQTLVSAEQPGDVRLDERDAPRARFRDENLDPTAPRDVRQVKAEGDGADDVP